VVNQVIQFNGIRDREDETYMIFYEVHPGIVFPAEIIQGFTFEMSVINKGVIHFQFDLLSVRYDDLHH
jgi:hypothetical protein